MCIQKNSASVLFCCSTLRHRIISPETQIVFQDTMKHKHSGTNAAHVANKVPQLLKTRSLAKHLRLLMDDTLHESRANGLSHEVFKDSYILLLLPGLYLQSTFGEVFMLPKLGFHSKRPGIRQIKFRSLGWPSQNLGDSYRCNEPVDMENVPCRFSNVSTDMRISSINIHH